MSKSTRSPKIRSPFNSVGEVNRHPKHREEDGELEENRVNEDTCSLLVQNSNNAKEDRSRNDDERSDAAGDGKVHHFPPLRD